MGGDSDKREYIVALLLYAVLAARQGRIIVVSTPTDYEGQNWESVGAIHARARIVLQTLTFFVKFTRVSDLQQVLYKLYFLYSQHNPFETNAQCALSFITKVSKPTAEIAVIAVIARIWCFPAKMRFNVCSIYHYQRLLLSAFYPQNRYQNGSP